MNIPSEPPPAYTPAPTAYDNSPTILYVGKPSQPAQQQKDDPEINHLFHLIVCLIFPPWLLVWLCLCFLYHVDY